MLSGTLDSSKANLSDWGSTEVTVAPACTNCLDDKPNPAPTTNALSISGALLNNQNSKEGLMCPISSTLDSYMSALS